MAHLATKSSQRAERWSAAEFGEPATRARRGTPAVTAARRCGGRRWSGRPAGSSRDPMRSCPGGPPASPEIRGPHRATGRCCPMCGSPCSRVCDASGAVRDRMNGFQIPRPDPRWSVRVPRPARRHACRSSPARPPSPGGGRAARQSSTGGDLVPTLRDRKFLGHLTHAGMVSQPRTVEVGDSEALSRSTSHSGKRLSSSSRAMRPSRRASAEPRQ